MVLRTTRGPHSSPHPSAPSFRPFLPTTTPLPPSPSIMPSILATKDDPKPNGDPQYIETVVPGLLGVQDDLIVADGEDEVSVLLLR